MPDYFLVTISGRTFFGIPKAWNVIKNTSSSPNRLPKA